MHYLIPCANAVYCGAAWCSARCMAVDWRHHAVECESCCAPPQQQHGPGANHPGSVLATATHQVLPREVLLAARLVRQGGAVADEKESLGVNEASLLFHLGRVPPRQLAELVATAYVATRVTAFARDATARQHRTEQASRTIDDAIAPTTRDGGGGNVVSIRAHATNLLVALLQVRANVMAVRLPPGGQLCGLAVYRVASLANHSCVPNASVAFDGHRIALRATRPLAAGEGVTMSYGPEAASNRDAAARRAHLRDKYSFECVCEACRG